MKSGHVDASAETLAIKLGGLSSVMFADEGSVEFDTVSDLFIAQTTSRTKMNKRFRTQARNTFEAASATGRKVYYEFQRTPEVALINKLQQYANEYNVELIIDVLK